jgi:hypothetical protein
MKRQILFLLAFGLGVAVAVPFVSRFHATRHAHELEVQRTAWETQKAGFEAALADVKRRANRTSDRLIPAEPVTVDVPKATRAILTAQEILEKLRAARMAPGPGQSAAVRQVIVLFSELAQSGPEALPAIRQFFSLNQDVDYDANPGGKGMRDIKALTDSVLPVSMRIGLFDVVRQIGGEAAEKLLADVLTTTGRGVEVAYLARVLDQMAPGKYTETALNSARDLLAKGAPVSNSALDRFHRDYLYDVLKLFRDTSYVGTAQSQLIQPDGKVDRSALRYLQQTLGDQTLPIVARAFQDGRLTQAESREPLARVALAYVGADANEQAQQLWHNSIFDPVLTPAQRRELVLDLDQDGLQNDKTPTPVDLPIVAKRLAITQAYLQQDYVRNDPALTKAFLEANKDLQKLLERGTAAAAKPSGAPAPGGK